MICSSHFEAKYLVGICKKNVNLIAIPTILVEVVSMIESNYTGNSDVILRDDYEMKQSIECKDRIINPVESTSHSNPYQFVNQNEYV